jgi:hypothetical protein
MTLIVCLLGRDTIVVATDSRATFDDEKETCHNDNSKKIYLVENVAICGAGTAHTNTLVEVIDPKPVDGVTNIMNKMRGVAKQKFDKWYPNFPLFANPNQNPNFVRPRLEFSIAGYDFVQEQSFMRVYTMNSKYDFVPVRYDDGFVLSGITQYARYLLNMLYSQDMNTQALERLAAYVIIETTIQNEGVGGRVQMATITPNSGANMLTNDEIDSLLKENENRAKGLKDIFKTHPASKK